MERSRVQGLKRKPVIGQLHPGWEGGSDIGMFSHLMAEVRKPGMGNFQPADFPDSF